MRAHPALQAPALVAFSLAHSLWKALARRRRRAGLGDAPRIVLEEFTKIKSGDVRCVATPDEARKVLLNRLGVSLPQRLRRIDEVAQM